MTNAASNNQPSYLQSVAAKAAYSRATRDKLVASRGKLDTVNAALRRAISTGRLRNTEELEKARVAMEINFREAERRLAQLQKAGFRDWQSFRDEVDDAWEDLSRSIQNLVARFDHEARED